MRPFIYIPDLYSRLCLGYATISIKVPIHVTNMNETPNTKYFTEQLPSGVPRKPMIPIVVLSILWIVDGGEADPSIGRTTSLTTDYPVVVLQSP
jgi:hypothetical protein